jgi:hypothetical protein
MTSDSASAGSRRGSALLLGLFILLLLEIVVAGLFWILRSESRAGLQSLAVTRAAAAADAARARALDGIARAAPESLSVVLGRMPPPVHLAGRAVGYAELTRIDSTLVEVVAQGFAGQSGIGARRQVCVLLEVRVAADTAGVARVQATTVPDRAVTNC